MEFDSFVSVYTSCINFMYKLSFPGGSDSKASACNAEDPGLIPGLGRSPGEGNGNPLQYSCLENPMDGGAWGCRLQSMGLQRVTFTFILHVGPPAPSHKYLLWQKIRVRAIQKGLLRCSLHSPHYPVPITPTFHCFPFPSLEDHPPCC